MQKLAIANLTLDELQKELERLGIERFRASQITSWYYKKNANSFYQMQNIPDKIKEKLDRYFTLDLTSVYQTYKSKDSTVKFLIRLADNEFIETVLIPEKTRKTICVSTQVGCPVRCLFCASGLYGLRRNLEISEIVEQVIHVKRFIGNERITNIVFMGVGEPLLNYQNIIKALRILKANWGLNIGYNKMTLSTIGIIKKINCLIADKTTPNLAISLHASDDETRKKLIPIARNHDMRFLIKEGLRYRKLAKKDVTFEYVLIGDINDSKKDALRLAKKLRGKRCKVNIIPFNHVDGIPFCEPSKEAIDRFVDILGSHGIFVTIRKRRGDDINAACGQLRIKERHLS